MEEIQSFLATPGDIIGGRYEIVELIGRGAFAEVYLGQDTILGREVAIKLMSFQGVAKPGLDLDKMLRDVTSRFFNEGRMVARLRDGATITLFDFGSEHDGALYMVLEYIPGKTLRQVLDEQGKITPLAAVTVMQRVLESLREAHSQGLLHRDIKPENIMIFNHMGEPWHVRVLDFGIAKTLEDKKSAMTAAGILVGTPRYVPPERVLDQELLPASDLYSLGAVAYFMLTGKELYAHTRNTFELVKLQMSPESATLPQDIGLPPKLVAVVDKMLRKDVTQRYRAAQQVLDDLELIAVELMLEKYDMSSNSLHTQQLPSIGSAPLDQAATINLDLNQVSLGGDVRRTAPGFTPNPSLQQSTVAPTGHTDAFQSVSAPPSSLRGRLSQLDTTQLAMLIVIGAGVLGVMVSVGIAALYFAFR